MSIGQFLLLLIVAGVCGSIAQSLAGYSHSGCLVTILLGFIGALLGQKLAGLLGMPEPFVLRIGSESFPLVWTIIGATLFVAALNMIRTRRWRSW